MPTRLGHDRKALCELKVNEGPAGVAAVGIWLWERRGCDIEVSYFKACNDAAFGFGGIIPGGTSVSVIGGLGETNWKQTSS